MLKIISLPRFWTAGFFDSMKINYPVFPMLGVYCIEIWLGSVFDDYHTQKPIT